MSDDPDAFMTKAKESLTAQRDKVLTKRDAIDAELSEIDNKLSRIEAYFNPAATREPAPTRKPRTVTGTRAPRKAGVRDEVLAKIAENPDGISRKDLLTAMGADSKNAEQSVSNAVAALTKEGKITAPSKGHYRAA